MKILIDTSKIKDRYSLFYVGEPAEEYYVTMSKALENHIKRIVDLKGYITMTECFKLLEDYLGVSSRRDCPIEYMLAGYVNIEDVEVKCTTAGWRERYQFDFCNVRDISPMLLVKEVIRREQILREGYYD